MDTDPRPAPVSRLTDHTGYWLNRLRADVHGSFERALAGLGITVAQWNVLVVLYHDTAATPQALATALAIDSGAVTRLLDRLAAKGLLARAPSTADRRSVELALTPAGRALTPTLAALADRNDAAFLGPLSAAERRQFRALLARLLEARGVAVTPRWRDE